MEDSTWPNYRPKKSTIVAQWVLQEIKNGSYAIGSKLPSERKIAEALGVSRPPVREALSALQLTEVVEIRAGDGTYVASSAPGGETVDNTISALEETESPFEIMQARRVLEGGIVEVAAEKATEKDVKKLERIVARMEEAANGNDLSGYFAANREFHLGVASASHNGVLEGVLESLLVYEEKELWQESIHRYLSEPGHIKKYIERHKEVLNAIEAGDAGRAHQEMREHFSGTVEEVREYL